MQNVSLLIGVPVITPGNRRITELRRYVVQCYACFQLVQDGNLSINRVCPGCGYLTLSKISCTVMANGKVVLHKKKHWRPARGVQ
jgi:RNA-binding protein NOB1